MSYEIDAFFTPALLMSESKEEYENYQAAFERELAPRTIIEATYVAEIVVVSWRIKRFCRAEGGIINAAFEPALQNLLIPAGGYIAIDTQLLARRWFLEEKAKREVKQTLAERGLDETAIESEALRLSLGSLEIIEKMLAAAEARRSRLFRSLEECRASSAIEVRPLLDRAISDRPIESGGEVFNLEDFSDKKSA